MAMSVERHYFNTYYAYTLKTKILQIPYQNLIAEEELGNLFMKHTLYSIAKEYVSVIEKIERTSDPKTLQVLEEQRVELHWEFIAILRNQGIQFKDRDHATNIAMKIAKGEI